MPTRRLDGPEWNKWSKHNLCLHYAHNPPMHQVFKPGLYEHICPACGHKTIFRVPGLGFNEYPKF